MRPRIALLLVAMAATNAAARPPPPPDEHEQSVERPAIEWSTWFRLGAAWRQHDEAPIVARATTPPMIEDDRVFDAAIGLDMSIGVTKHGDLRVGPWFELRGWDPIGGGEIVITGLPKRLDLFWYSGTGILAVRGGANAQDLTAAVAYGYLAPWKLGGPWSGASRYMIGARLVATYTRAIDDPRDWSASVGLEVEPVGALRYLLGIRSWY